MFKPFGYLTIDFSDFSEKYKYPENKHSDRIISRRKEKEAPCEPCGKLDGCRVEAVLTIDDRGQMVLPKDIREKAGIRTGDKLALISWGKDGSVCCLTLMKADRLNIMVKDILGPLIDDMNGR